MNRKQAKPAILTTAVLTVVVNAGAGSIAYAAPHEDFFSRSTNTVTIPPASSIPRPPSKPLYHYGEKPAQKWFATLDEQVCTHLATPDEKRILSDDFGNPPQLEKVILWTNTAAGVAKKFRQLSRTLRSLPVPMTLQGDPEVPTDVGHYRIALADWYDTQASVLEEYIKPRPPAHTQEELDEQLKRVHDRADNVKTTFTHLAEMDTSLRQHYGVRSAEYGDALMRYVKTMPDNLKKPQ